MYQNYRYIDYFISMQSSHTNNTCTCVIKLYMYMYVYIYNYMYNEYTYVHICTCIHCIVTLCTILLYNGIGFRIPRRDG